MKVLKDRGMQVTVSSYEPVIFGEMNHTAHNIKVLWNDLDITQFDGMMVVGGNPLATKWLWEDPQLRRFVETMAHANKPCAGICGGVAMMRYACKGKKVTFYPIRQAREALMEVGAIPVHVSIVRDGNVLTGEHRLIAEQWANEFCNMLEGKPTNIVEEDQTPFRPKSKPRSVSQTERMLRTYRENREKGNDAT
jgi:putative intracellular protease/amidase